MRAALLGIAVIFGGPLGCAATAAPVQPSPRVVAQAGAPVTVGFRRDPQGRVLLDGAVSGRPATVHLDSGAVATLVSPGLIDADEARRVDTAILNDSAWVERWRGVRIDLGPLSIEPDLVVAVDRAGRADVLIGNAVFDHMVVGVDYEARRVTFQSPAAFTPPDGATALRLGRDGRRVTSHVSINGGPDICVGVDLGFNGSLSLAPWVVESQGLKTNPAIEVTHHTVGRNPVRVPGLQRLERVTIAGFDFGNVSASPGGFDDSRCGSLLGTELLSGFHLVFDLSRDTLWLAPREDLSPRFETLMGITYRATPSGMLVTAISEASPALGVVEIGDRIVGIEGEPPAFILSSGEMRTPATAASPTAPGYTNAE